MERIIKVFCHWGLPVILFHPPSHSLSLQGSPQNSWDVQFHHFYCFPREVILIKPQARSSTFFSLRSIGQALCIRNFHSWVTQTWRHVSELSLPCVTGTHLCQGWGSSQAQLCPSKELTAARSPERLDFFKAGSQIAGTKPCYFNRKICSAGAGLQKRTDISFCVRHQQVIWCFSMINTIGHIWMVDGEMRGFIFYYQIPEPSGS